MPTPLPCFHCGLPVDPASAYSAEIGGQARPMCCPGCQAVAQAIADGGLDRFYQQRTAHLLRPQQLTEEQQAEIRLYDHPDSRADFVHALGADRFEAELAVEGITCAACTWLIEQHLRRLEGVTAAQVNLSTHRLHLTWEESKARLSQLVRALTDIGYRAFPYRADAQADSLKQAQRSALIRLGVAGFGTMQSMMFAIALYGDNSATPQYIELFRWVSMFVATPVVLYAAYPFFRNAVRDLKVRHLTMDVPVSLAIGLAYGASCWITVYGGEHVYFDSVCMFTFFLLLGRFLEARTRQRMTNLNQTADLLPGVALKVEHDNERWVATATLKAGDQVRVKPGQRIPADGVIREGESNVDESAWNGEFIPVAKQPGDHLVGGTYNVGSPLRVELSHAPQQGKLSQLLRLLSRAQSEKPASARLADRVASYFVAAVLVSATLVFALWWQQGALRAFEISLAVLVVTCPCALSLATPAAITAAVGQLKSIGFLITRGHVLEALQHINTVVFDKTGTLTEGELALLGVQGLTPELDRDTLLARAAALEAYSDHPVARVLKSLHTPPHLDQPAEDCREVEGQGVEGVIAGRRYRLGNHRFVAELSGTSPTPLDDDGAISVWLGDSQQVLARLQFSDRLRSESHSVVASLQQAGCHVVLLSGDQSGHVRATAEAAGIDDWHSGCTPQAKLAFVQQRQQQGQRVLMVGDGVNDIPVLSSADVSIAMQHASELAKTKADVVLLKPDLTLLAQAMTGATRARRVIKQNLAWALLYNASMLPLAALGHIPPYWAAIGMSLSSLLVVSNAMRLVRPARSGQAPAQGYRAAAAT